MKNTPRSFLHLLSVAAVVLTGAARSNAQTVSPMPAPTMITSAPYTISAPGYYQLGANLNYSGTGAANDAIITVNASNVTIDFAGHYIAGPTTNSATNLMGVYSNERANVIVQNGTIAYCFAGINLIGDNQTNTNFLNARILNMTVTKCYQTGIGLLYGVTPEINGCRVSSIGGTTASANADGVGISDDGNTAGVVSNCTVANITAEGTGVAFAVYNPGFAKNNVLANATVGIIYGKYQDNLTLNLTTPFEMGTDAGGNN